jgi:hypothetical protein
MRPALSLKRQGAARAVMKNTRRHCQAPEFFALIASSLNEVMGLRVHPNNAKNNAQGQAR